MARYSLTTNGPSGLRDLFWCCRTTHITWSKTHYRALCHQINHCIPEIKCLVSILCDVTSAHQTVEITSRQLLDS